jgi:hypothetical protein
VVIGDFKHEHRRRDGRTSDVIKALTEGFLRSLGIDDVERSARWLVRVMTSLLTFACLTLITSGFFVFP